MAGIKRFAPIPSLADPRWLVALLQSLYLLLGLTLLGFNRSPGQIAVTILSAIAVDLLFQMTTKRLLPQRQSPIVFPLSAFISGLGLSIILNYPHGLLYPLLPVTLSIASKYLVTFDKRHVFNPTLFGAALTIFFTSGHISSAPSYQWGGTLAISVFIATGAIVLFMPRIQRKSLVGSFLGLYLIATLIRAYLFQDMVAFESTLLSAVTSPALYLFAFFMITDPATSPKRPLSQWVMSFTIVSIDFALQMNEVLSSIIWSTFLYFLARFVYLHGQKIFKHSSSIKEYFFEALPRMIATPVLCTLVFFLYTQTSAKSPYRDIGVSYQERMGVFKGPSGNTLQQLDPRVQHIGKWVISIGDSVSIADFDNDGLMDVFLTNPLNQEGFKAQLYRNLNNHQFEAVETIEDLTQPTSDGLITGSLWLDYDNDGDKDLLLLVSFGPLRLLKNLLSETGDAKFAEVSEEVGFDQHSTSVTAVALDIDQNGYLDLVVGHSFNRFLNDYIPPRPFNPFALPQPEYAGDRRMLNFMNRTWHDANNGGGFTVYLGDGNVFRFEEGKNLGLRDKRWVLDIGVSDFNQDGWPDLYASNDFGPDQLLINQSGKRFEAIEGVLTGEIGRDTYKGMNVTIADYDNNGHQDMYISNMHAKLQPEGSMLWMNQGQLETLGYLNFRDESSLRKVENKNRFAWGATTADFDRNGWFDLFVVNGYLDIIQENPRATECPDYWYWNQIVAASVPNIHGYADQWADLRGRCLFGRQGNRFYLNNKGRFFEMPQLSENLPHDSARGVATADFLNSGRIDLVVARMSEPTLLIIQEKVPNKPWLGIELRGNGQNCNTDALGSKISIEWENEGTRRKQTREYYSKNGMSAQNDPRIVWGLAEANPNTPVKVVVDWCGTQDLRTYSLMPNKHHSLRQKQESNASL